MRKVVGLIGVGLLFVSVGVKTQQAVDPAQLATPPAKEPGWAFPVQQATLPNLDPAGPRTLAGSTKKYTQEEIDNLLVPPDWFPNDHPAAPSIVTKGHGGALACGSCHLMSGIGHPESEAMGAGETAITIVAAAVGNAVFDATGVRLREIPFTPVRVKAALAAARGNQTAQR